MTLCSVTEAIHQLRAGRPLIVVDDEGRENEGDLVVSAEKATPETINFMTKYARGLVCMPVIGERLDELGISLAESQRRDLHETAFTVSVDVKQGTTSGISAYDRSATVKAIVDQDTKAEAFVSPGHMFPLRYRPGGVLERPGHTEASVDLSLLAGFYPAAVICEILKDDGSMARMPDLEDFAQIHDLRILSIEQLIAFRKGSESMIERVTETRLPTKYGEFRAIAYKSHLDQGEHLVLTKGHWDPDEPVTVRIHSECLTGDALGSLRCDCGDQLTAALEILGSEDQGVLIYMRQEGRGIGLHNKLRAYALQDLGLDTVEANRCLGFPPDAREYGVCAQILADLRVNNIQLLTNNPRKLAELAQAGLNIIERIPLEVPPIMENLDYLETKRVRMGHMLSNCHQTRKGQLVPIPAIG